MADTKISELASATALTENDVLCGVNLGSTKKFTLARILSFFKTTLDGDYAAKTHTHNSLSNGAYTVGIPSTIKKNDYFVLQSEKTASNISYDNTASKMDAENVQNAIDELKNQQGKGEAANITYVGTESGLSGANVQDAIDEVVSDLSNTDKGVETLQKGLKATNENVTNLSKAVDANTKNIKGITDKKGKSGGYAELGADGLVPTAELPVFISGVSVTIKNMAITISATKSR